MIFAVLDPSPLTVCINCSFFTFILIKAPSHALLKMRAIATDFVVWLVCVLCFVSVCVSVSRTSTQTVSCELLGFCLYFFLIFLLVLCARLSWHFRQPLSAHILYRIVQSYGPVGSTAHVREPCKMAQLIVTVMQPYVKFL